MWVVEYSADEGQGYYAYCRSYLSILEIPFPINRSYFAAVTALQSVENTGEYEGPMSGRMVTIRRV